MGRAAWYGRTGGWYSVLSQDSWGQSEGKKRNINPNGEGGGCEGNQALNHFCPLAIPEYFS